MDIIPVKGLV